MCTAITYKKADHYFGRNLDLEYSYNEEVVITPRNYPFTYRCLPASEQHYAMIGMATVEDGYPLYYEATNEHGLSMAGLNFPGNAVYFPKRDDRQNVAPFELIPWVLGQCTTISEVQTLLASINIADIPFSEEYPLTPLHWLIADCDSSIVLEQTEDGLKIYKNPVGLLTNNPPFPYHLYNLQNYMNLSTGDPKCQFAPDLCPELYSRGMGAIGLPGDASSASRFVRAAFTKLNSVSDCDENSAVSQFFHILNSVAMHRGSVIYNGKVDITLYSSCCNTDKGIYYYTTYDNCQITAINMFAENLDGNGIVAFPLNKNLQIKYEN